MNISVPRIVEKQTELRCGKHAINNLFQRRNFATCQKLEKNCKTIIKNIFHKRKRTGKLYRVLRH